MIIIIIYLIHSIIFIKTQELTEQSKLFKIWPKDDDNWKNAKIGKEKKLMYEQLFLKSEYFADCEYELKIDPIYYFPGETIELSCRICKIGLMLNGLPKRWGRVNNIFEFLEKYKHIRTGKGPQVEIIENYPFLDTAYSQSVLGKFYRHKSKSDYLDIPIYSQSNGKLIIEHAHPKSMGVYFCFDSLSHAAQRYFYVLIPLTPMIQKIPHVIEPEEVCSVKARTYPHFSWSDDFIPMHFDERETCYERYGKESMKCVGTTQLAKFKGCENPGIECSTTFKLRNIPMKLYLKWSDWSDCDENREQRREGMCYLKLERNIKPSREISDRDAWLRDFNKLTQFSGFHDGIPINSGLIPLMIYKVNEFVGCIDEENAKDDEKKCDFYNDSMGEILKEAKRNWTDLPTGFSYCFFRQFTKLEQTDKYEEKTSGTYVNDIRQC
ncbi:unnamed protein product [Caenorhabditis angaria]|uniref:Glycosyltransferase family 92 protein n=1 Tax=Caenorhabditis angaria TaxID=860376 RepID=A0A9P1IC02_9PELO|nr:unnamed protein product [Caenorhabditis angaria]